MQNQVQNNSNVNTHNTVYLQPSSTQHLTRPSYQNGSYMPKSEIRVSHVREGEKVLVAENRLPSRIVGTK